MRRKIPFVAVAIVVFVILASAASEVVIYDRQQIRDGEIWRLVTGNLVHFSFLHAFLNLIVVVPIVAYLERRSRLQAIVAVFIISAVVGAGLYLLEPSLVRFGGLSGVACGLVVWIGCLWVRVPSDRVLGVVALVAIAFKLGFFNDDRWMSSLPDFIAVASLSHVLGAAAGLLALFFSAQICQEEASASNCADVA